MGLLTATFALGHRWLLLRGVRSRTVDAAGVPVHFYDAPGTGPLGTIVLQHGIGARALHFVPMLRSLRRHFGRVILTDLPGHGLSGAPAALTPAALFTGFAAVMDTAVPEPAVVFGNSLGGAVAVKWASERPERTRALLLASPAGARLEGDALLRFLANFAFPDTRSVLAFFARLHPRVPFGSALFAGDVRADFHRPAVRALLASVGPDDQFTPELVGALRPPTLLLWGRLDGLMPREMLAWYRRHLPSHATIEEPDALGHCPQVDDPGWTARRIRVFTEQLSPLLETR